LRINKSILRSMIYIFKIMGEKYQTKPIKLCMEYNS
jgi:hypothetical protein